MGHRFGKLWSASGATADSMREPRVAMCQKLSFDAGSVGAKWHRSAHVTVAGQGRNTPSGNDHDGS
jgi:hypothetical protein